MGWECVCSAKLTLPATPARKGCLKTILSCGFPCCSPRSSPSEICLVALASTGAPTGKRSPVARRPPVWPDKWGLLGCWTPLLGRGDSWRRVLEIKTGCALLVAEVTLCGACPAPHNGPWSSRSMWMRCSRSGSPCWTSTCGLRPADPEPQRRPGDISNPPRGPSVPVPLQTWSRHHAPFSLSAGHSFCIHSLVFGDL